MTQPEFENAARSCFEKLNKAGRVVANNDGKKCRLLYKTGELDNFTFDVDVRGDNCLIEVSDLQGDREFYFGINTKTSEILPPKGDESLVEHLINSIAKLDGSRPNSVIKNANASKYRSISNSR
jgi:hypothetical protein